MGPALLSFLAMAALALLGRAAAGGLALPDRTMRLLGWGGVALAGLLLLARQATLAATLAGLSAALLIRTPAGRGGGGRQAASTARSEGLAMRLDHESGEMDGEVLAGGFAGRALSSMTLEELLAFAAEIPEDDPDTARLLRAYLDRVHPDWRGAAGGTPPESPPQGGMTRADALSLLGLEEGADRAAVLDAHRRLMKRVHPDLGGSAALAAQINEAKDRLLAEL